MKIYQVKTQKWHVEDAGGGYLGVFPPRINYGAWNVWE